MWSLSPRKGHGPPKKQPASPRSRCPLRGSAVSSFAICRTQDALHWCSLPSVGYKVRVSLLGVPSTLCRALGSLPVPFLWAPSPLCGAHGPFCRAQSPHPLVQFPLLGAQDSYPHPYPGLNLPSARHWSLMQDTEPQPSLCQAHGPICRAQGPPSLDTASE